MPQLPESLFGLVAGQKPPSAQDMISKLMEQIGTDSGSMDQLFSALGARRDAASQAESTAHQNLQQAQAAPMPQTPPLADLVTRALGSVASSFMGSDEASKQAKDLIEAEQKQLMLKRAQDLAQLGDVYDKAYDRASKLGDLDTQLKFADKKDQLHEKRVAAIAALGAQVDLETTNLRGQYSLREAAVRANNATQGFNPSDHIETSSSGVEYINIADIPTQQAKLLAKNYAASHKMPTTNAIESNVLSMVRDARSNIETIRSTIIPELETDWKNIFGRGMKWVDANTQKNPALASYPAIRTAAIQFIQTIAGLGKGLRINQAEIQAALKYDIPEVWDTQDVANAKLELLSIMINHVESAALGLSTSESAGPNFIKRSRDLHSQSQKIYKGASNPKADKTSDIQDFLDEHLPGIAGSNP